jgi:S1-C subfamily serine protease
MAEPAAKPGAKQTRRRRWTIPAGIAALFLGGLALFFVPSEPEPLIVEEPPQKEMTAADAYEKIRGSVVMVRGSPYDGTEEVETHGSDSTGTGVVIVDSGIILTNLHVVDGAKRIRVIFADGTEAAADLLGARPEHDLAVLKAQSVPDDLEPATMRSTAGLRPGEAVVAVGFPFGIGPSASAGVISGLGREYRSAEGKRILTNLIQFDAAVNPGNSGGPLVTNEGEVIGIVTGLLNPTEQRVFVGIGFAVPIENAAAAVGLPPF